VRLEVEASSWVGGTLEAPLDAVTVLANLVDNAIRAAASGVRRPATVTVTLLSDRRDLVMHVVDSGDGIRPADVEAVFGHGFSTRPGDEPGHGIGLALARQIARTHGGDVVLRRASGPDHGAMFEARLAGVLATADLTRSGGTS
jgi:two-component system CitB family sensor kinase